VVQKLGDVGVTGILRLPSRSQRSRVLLSLLLRWSRHGEWIRPAPERRGREAPAGKELLRIGLASSTAEAATVMLCAGHSEALLLGDLRRSVLQVLTHSIERMPGL